MGGLLLIIVFIVSLVLAYFVTGYRILARCRRDAIVAWKDFDTVMRKRHDLANQLEGALRNQPGAAQIQLAKAARRAAEAGGDVANRAAAEHELAETLRSGQALLEAHPELREQQVVQHVLAELETTQRAFDERRDAYNATADVYNQARSGGLSGPLAAPFGFKPAVRFGSVE